MEEQPSTVVQTTDAHNTDGSIQKTDASVSVHKRDSMTAAKNTITEEPVLKLKSETDDIDSAASEQAILVKNDIVESE